ncbi:MAG: cytochrome P450 [Proteobacteria bacterium]|nr:cytochrome P450 [Pseudomonadota bacterium]
MEDFSLPSNDGVSYRIKKGDTLIINVASAHRDDNVFERPYVFDPDRFERESKLKAKVWPFGRAKNSSMPYGCAGAASGHAAFIWKRVIAEIIPNYQWSFEQEPVFSINHMFEVAPYDLRVTNFRKIPDDAYKTGNAHKKERITPELCPAS